MEELTAHPPRVILFCLARAAALYGSRLHAICFASNHYHLGLTDPHGLLPEFAKWVNQHLARCLNCHLGRVENFFDSSRGSYVRLVGPEDVFDKLVYTLTNPVAAGLVAKGSQWPGVRSRPDQYGEVLEVEKPDFFFRPGGVVPDKVKLQLTVPPGFENHSDAIFGRRLTEAVEAREAEIRQRFREKGRRFLGARGVRQQSAFGSPTSPRGFGQLNPRVACKDKWRRIEVLTQLRAFWKEYKAALDAYFSGDHDVIFPAGTYWMRVKHGVRCRRFPPGALSSAGRG